MANESAPAQGSPAPKMASSTPLTVAAIMTSKVVSVLTDMTIRETIQLVLKNKISGVPVVDSTQKVMTVLSEGDLLKLAASVGLDKTIFQCMTRLTKKDKLLTIKKTDIFADVYKRFLSHPVHRLIVVDDIGRLEGIVSRSNVLRVLAGPGPEESTETKSGDSANTKDKNNSEPRAPKTK